MVYTEIIHRPYTARIPVFCSSLLNNIFISYYIDLFVNVVRVEPGWFFAGQAVFMLWNAANDPLLGWISDTTSCHERSVSGLRWITASFASALVHGVAAVFRPLSPELALRLIKVFIFEGGSTGEAATAATWNRRVDMIRLGGLLWCASFLVLWWPWSAALSSQLGSDQSSAWVLSLLSGLHFTGEYGVPESGGCIPHHEPRAPAVSLCLYDGFLTYTEVNHSALLAELSLDQVGRQHTLARGGSKTRGLRHCSCPPLRCSLPARMPSLGAPSEEHWDR